MLIPRNEVPSLIVPILGGGSFDLSQESPKNFTMIVFYRGLHCPVCAKYLMELSRLQSEFDKRGVNIIAISSDSEDRAKSMAEKVRAKDLRFGFGLDLSVARNWGLYISSSKGKTSIGIEEPQLFSEPGVFLIRPDNTLYYGNVQTMPFARPVFSELLSAIDFALEKDYPARGEYAGKV